MKKFKLAICDTDSVFFCKENGEEFSVLEQVDLLTKLNSLFPENINWEKNGYFPKVIVLKTKNYALWDGKKLTIKGSALRDSKKPQALKEFTKELIDAIIEDKNIFVDIYQKYIKEALEVKDINRWCSKITVTDTVLKANRTREKRILFALEGTEYSEGDKRYVYTRENKSLGLAEDFNGEYDKWHLIKSIWETAKIFENVIDKNLFVKFHLKKNRNLCTIS